MSEDLDFVINTDVGQNGRKKLLKDYENNFIEDLKILGIHLREERTKFDSYKLEENFDNLKKQVQTDLKPVLNNDFSFHFEEIYDFILSFKK